jgi:hypothetical protein
VTGVRSAAVRQPTARTSAAPSASTASSRTDGWVAWSSSQTQAAETPSSRTTASAAASIADRTGKRGV